jgi:hypothetical protein
MGDLGGGFYRGFKGFFMQVFNFFRINLPDEILLFQLK